MNDLAFYFPDGGASEIWGAAVTACGRTGAVPGGPYPPNPRQHPGDHLFWLPQGGRILDCYQLLYISSGKGWFESTATGKVEMKAGSAFLLFPEVWHRYSPDPESGWTEYFIELRGPNLERLRQAGVLRPQNAVFHPGLDTELVEAFHALHRLARQAGAGGREQMGTLGMYLLARLIFSSSARELSPEEKAVRQTESRMREKLGESFDMTELAREFGVGYDRFRRFFKALTGLPPKHYYRKLQMRRAEELLLHTERNLAEIAEELGFNTAFHLSAAFKEHAGIAPSHWRERRRGVVDLPQALRD
ncbi:MAG: AraC family transcriptional regulator [Verrucomicrobia bacterium]|nr:AraC family transcriptional regulator [Verrucomicrobiota bacterium]